MILNSGPRHCTILSLTKIWLFSWICRKNYTPHPREIFDKYPLVAETFWNYAYYLISCQKRSFFVSKYQWNPTYGEFRPKNSYFEPLKLSTKKNTTKFAEICETTLVSQKITKFNFETTLVSQKKTFLQMLDNIIIWEVKLARLRFKDEAPFKTNDVLIFV